ncbi:uncharacterized protein YbjT (DUF2867 family) [Chitinophaga skermanii]|uniref:Uncharacterized protein YbjT (DUF2867 family) n=1 Tax=Chitinophaga skermanii TaxID=331697 RepID=A0A327PZZ6_9BACT|nr:NmrA family NAD(P)-binding protein [Chitinophaga skermanii]RAI97708.1 uncharacterized protein YbjT (DUF2867 family) [Chitinophaga skermanii]
MKKIIVSGSLGNIGKTLTGLLVKDGHDVTVITSSPGRTQAIEALGAKAAVGSVSDPVFLTNTLQGADALFAMTPPNMGGENIVANTVNAGKAFADAITKSGVPRVVMLSSVGAEYTDGTGPIKGLHQIENLYRQIPGISLTILRAGYFYTNFFNDVAMIQHMNIMGSNFPGDVNLPVVHPDDIAAKAAQALLVTPTGTDIQYVVSDVRQPNHIASVLGNAAGKPGLPWVPFTDEQALSGMTQAGLPAEMAGLYVEMGQAIRDHKLMTDFEKNGSPVIGNIKLEDFAKTFATKFTA